MQKAMNFNVAILSIKGNEYRIHFWYMSKDEAITIMHNSILNEKTGKMSETTYKMHQMNLDLNHH